MAQPLKVATPATAAFERPPVQVRMPPPGFVPMARVTVAVEPMPLVTVLPPASWMATIGCGTRASPAVDVPGCVVKPSFAAGPAVIVSMTLVADVRPVAVATSWYGFAGDVGLALSILQPANAARPFATVLMSPLVQLRTAPTAPVPDLIARLT